MLPKYPFGFTYKVSLLTKVILAVYLSQSHKLSTQPDFFQKFVREKKQNREKKREGKKQKKEKKRNRKSRGERKKDCKEINKVNA